MGKKALNLQCSSKFEVATGFPIVGIGASAGGLDPIRKLLETLPYNTGMSFVVIQHLATGQESMLPEILSRSTKMNVLQAKDTMKVEKNQVYVIAPGKTLTLNNGYFSVVPKGEFLKPIDDFFVSLASEKKTLAIGIVLSGTGNDGTEGLKAIKAEGGITFVQDPDTAQYSDMPTNAIAAEAAYFILPPEKIAKEVVRVVKNQKLSPFSGEIAKFSRLETDLRKIIIMLNKAYSVDFSHYKETTINRRISRRMAINKIETIKKYVAFLIKHPSELSALFDDLLIGVTSFFREPKTFEFLKEKVFTDLTKNRLPIESIRVWIPGCSTGEDVYSLAIMLQEFLQATTRYDIKVQIFGTDANEKNILQARQGLYPKTIEEKVSENRLKRFFTRQNGEYQITKLIRDMCIFAKHDITNDPPFSNLDLIMCRNVLIYFDSFLHERVFPIFHYGLKEDGFLVMGESESIGKFNYMFSPVARKGPIYRRKRVQPQTLSLQDAVLPNFTARKSRKNLANPHSMLSLKEEVDHILIEEYAPASFLVNNNLEILFFRGQVNPYLKHESGIASLNVAKIFRKELRSEVQTAIYRARKEKKTIIENIQFNDEEHQRKLGILVKPLKTSEYEDPFFLLTLREEISNISPSKESVSLTEPSAEIGQIKKVQELKEDLESTKQSLQSIIEIQEATNEELRSTMEEAQSSNEELQSTNEELETAKEELQSSNEELQTLNEELKNRNLALGLLNDDLTNLQVNIDVPVVIVDNNLNIRRFTSSAQDLFKISPSDVASPVSNLSIFPLNLVENIKKVISKLIPLKEDVLLEGDCLYEVNLRPYLTEEKKIAGAVITFSDITESKKMEQQLCASLEKAMQRESEISALLKASRAVLKNRDFQYIARAIFDVCKEQIRASAGYVALLSANSKENEVLFLDSGGLPCTVDTSLPMPIRGLRAEVYRTGKVSFENDFLNSEWQKFSPKGHVALNNVLFAPLIVENKTVGVIGLANKPGGFTQRDAEIAMALAQLASVALVNSQMLELLEKNEKILKMHSEHLETLVEERTLDLKNSERLAAIGATAGMVGHDIRNPLQAINSDIYLAKSELNGISNDEVKKNLFESLQGIEENAEYINKIVVDLQDFARPLNPFLEETDVKNIIDELLKKNRVPENVEVTAKVESEVRVIMVDSTYLNRIVNNLVNNAVQAMPKGGKLTVHVFKEENDVVLTVSDTGEGIAEAIKGKLFTPMFTTKSKGQGFGLAVIKRLSEALRGNVTFESELGKGSTFIVRLPDHLRSK